MSESLHLGELLSVESGWICTHVGSSFVVFGLFEPRALAFLRWIGFKSRVLQLAHNRSSSEHAWRIQKHPFTTRRPNLLVALRCWAAPSFCRCALKAGLAWRANPSLCDAPF